MAKKRRVSKKQKTSYDGSAPRTGVSRGSMKGAVCPYCGKRSYTSRRYAKEANRRIYPDEKMSAYRCLEAPEYADTNSLWHIGHLAPAIVEGKKTRDKVYGPKPYSNGDSGISSSIQSIRHAIVLPVPQEDAGDSDNTDNDDMD